MQGCRSQTPFVCCVFLPVGCIWGQQLGSKAAGQLIPCAPVQGREGCSWVCECCVCAIAVMLSASAVAYCHTGVLESLSGKLPCIELEFCGQSYWGAPPAPISLYRACVWPESTWWTLLAHRSEARVEQGWVGLLHCCTSWGVASCYSHRTDVAACCGSAYTLGLAGGPSCTAPGLGTGQCSLLSSYLWWINQCDIADQTESQEPFLGLQLCRGKKTGLERCTCFCGITSAVVCIH